MSTARSKRPRPTATVASLSDDDRAELTRRREWDRDRAADFARELALDKHPVTIAVCELEEHANILRDTKRTLVDLWSLISLNSLTHEHEPHDLAVRRIAIDIAHLHKWLDERARAGRAEYDANVKAVVDSIGKVEVPK